MSSRGSFFPELLVQTRVKSKNRGKIQTCIYSLHYPTGQIPSQAGFYYFTIFTRQSRIMRLSTSCILALALFVTNNLMAQDPQFSQYYAAPLHVNPALTGIHQKGSFGVNYRNQWPNIAATFETYSVYVDNHFEDAYSSVGLMVTTDREGIVGLQSTTIGLTYAYQVQLNPYWTFRPGVEVAYYMRDLNFSALTFGDQFDQNGLVIPVSAEQFNTGLKAKFFDISFGGILFNERMWVGSAIHHITEPNQSLTGEEARLPKRVSVHGGYKIPFGGMPARGRSRGPERSFTPTFNYKAQGRFDQLDLGAYITLEPLLLGLWYRGIPVKQADGVANSEAIIAMIGIQQKRTSIGYSFDYTISDLGIGTGGAHEISFRYFFSLADPRKPPREVRELRCPVPFIF
jgi:type IX secretion system PorP/SprF family membrane protein